MSKPEVEVKLYPAAFRAIDRAAQRALEKTAEAILTEVKTAQVIPFKTGHLQNDSTFVDIKDSKNGSVYIVSSTPYARRLYYHPEYKFDTSENANAQGRWYEPWVSGSEKDFAGNTFDQLVHKELGI